jgi:hypothetical protein
MTDLSIFNRWGERVHQDVTAANPKTWNGNIANDKNRSECPSDVYIYVARFAPIKDKTKVLIVKGQVTLLR